MNLINPLDLAHRLAGFSRLWLFLDYDGTLADFAPTPDTLLPDPELIDLVKRLSTLNGIRLAVISGRRLSHIQSLLPVPGIWLAGAYGAEVRTPVGRILNRLDLDAIRPALDVVKPLWSGLIAGKDGFYLEDKSWSLALHARFAQPDQARVVFTRARQCIPSPLPESLQVLDGDKFLEIAPAQVDKARTVQWLLSIDAFPGAMPIYAGDDDKDELAFQAIKNNGGLTIAVSARISQADFFLSSPAQVRHWLYELTRVREKAERE